MIPLLVALVLCQTLPAHAVGQGIGILRPAAGVRHASEDVCAISRACSPISRRADVIFVGEQHDDREHAPARAGGARGADPAAGVGRARPGDVRARRATSRRRVFRRVLGRVRVPRRRASLAALRDGLSRVGGVRERRITFRSSPRTSRDGSRRRLPRTGLAALESLGADRRLVAADLRLPLTGAYYDRFVRR